MKDVNRSPSAASLDDDPNALIVVDRKTMLSVPRVSRVPSADGSVSREAAEDAVRTLLKWAGDDPDREGLSDTPRRVVDAYLEYFGGYRVDPRQFLERTFEEVEGCDEIVMLKDIRFESHCEHHLAPIIGHVHVAYLPRRRVVGLSKLARVVDAYARRLQIQERLTVQIADTVDAVLDPRGVAVVIEATHQCMTMRGVRKSGALTTTSRTLGAFRDDPAARREILAMLTKTRGGGEFLA